GEYAVTVLGRERILDYFSRRHSQPMAILRLNYATELRYGVLVDIGQKVWNRQPVDVTMGYVNVIWQTEANAMAICALAGAEAPARIYNIAGPEILRIRDVAESFGRCMQREVQLTGAEGGDALLNNAHASYAQLGTPRITAEQMIRCTAAWIMRGGETSHKPTHFESRDGTF
ncbi:MAG: epimerase, partial [Pirellulaceae bacterium]